MKINLNLTCSVCLGALTSQYTFNISSHSRKWYRRNLRMLNCNFGWFFLHLINRYHAIASIQAQRQSINRIVSIHIESTCFIHMDFPHQVLLKTTTTRAHFGIYCLSLISSLSKFTICARRLLCVCLFNKRNAKRHLLCDVQEYTVKATTANLLPFSTYFPIRITWIEAVSHVDAVNIRLHASTSLCVSVFMLFFSPNIGWLFKLQINVWFNHVIIFYCVSLLEVVHMLIFYANDAWELIANHWALNLFIPLMRMCQ